MKKKLKTFAGFLRGINVGGNKKVAMADLKRMLESLGFGNVKTLLASGNIVFQTNRSSAAQRTTIEKTFLKTFGFESSIIIQPLELIDSIVRLDPFRDIEATPATRLYVTFLSGPVLGTITLPYESPEGGFRILSRTDEAVFSVLTLSEDRSTLDGMKVLEKEFGKDVTTRSWNTVIKMLK